MNDILDDVRRILPPDEVDEQRIRRNRSSLLQELSRRPVPRGRLALRAGLVATAGVAVVGTVTVLALNPPQTPTPAPAAATGEPRESQSSPSASAPTSPLMPNPTTTSSSAAVPSPTLSTPPEPLTVASVLARASRVAAETPTPTTGYRLISTAQTALYWEGHTEDGTSLGPNAPHEFVDVARLTTVYYDMYLPLTDEGQWIEVDTAPWSRGEVWGRADLLADPPDPDTWESHARTFFPNWYHNLLLPSQLSDVPRDPLALLDQLRAQRAEGEGWIVLWTLCMGYAPADLQAVLFDAAQLLPGAELLPSSPETAVIEWRDLSEPGKRMRINISTETWEVTAFDWWWGRPALLGIPDSVPDLHWDLSGSFVDSAPAVDTE